jgi:hypothetical protein
MSDHRSEEKFKRTKLMDDFVNAYIQYKALGASQLVSTSPSVLHPNPSLGTGFHGVTTDSVSSFRFSLAYHQSTLLSLQHGL